MRRILRDRVRQRVVVTLKSGETFSGVLWDWDREAFVLKQAVLHSPGETDVPVDNDWVVLAGDVAYLQFP